MWQTFSTIINIILAVITTYFYLESRKLKKFKIDRDIELKEIEIEEMKREHLNEVGQIKLGCTKYTEDGSPIPIMTTAYAECDNRYNNKFKKLEADLEYLNKLKKYRWIFSK